MSIEKLLFLITTSPLSTHQLQNVQKTDKVYNKNKKRVFDFVKNSR